jgi:hypothetical protein
MQEILDVKVRRVKMYVYVRPAHRNQKNDSKLRAGSDVYAPVKIERRYNYQSPRYLELVDLICFGTLALAC